MRITVFGATGGTGQQLVRQSLDAGHKVTAVVRNPDRLPIRHELLEVVTADITDPEALSPALAGSDAALSALGAPNNKGAGIASRGTRAILRALEAESVPRYLAVSAGPVGEQPRDEHPLFRATALPMVRRAFRAVYADLALMEEEIQGSRTDWTVLRPPRLTDKPGTGGWTLHEGSAVPRRHFITRADLASAMLKLRDEESSVRKVYGIAN